MLGARLWAVGIVAVGLAAFAGDANAQRSTRCATGRLIDVGMVSAEILARCGEPKSRTSEEIPVRTRVRSGAVVQTGVTRIEHWIYARGQGQFDALLRFEDDKLVKIEILTQR